ncbi:MAG: F0F1 ATP synthase subunit delta [Pseudomonadota bacterium]
MASADDTALTGMPGRYASALFELARDNGSLEAVEAQLAGFRQAIAESADLKRLVSSPVFSAQDQTRAISAVLESIGVGGFVANVLKIMAQNRRLFAAESMISAFNTLLSRHRGEVQAVVTSAEPLTGQQQDDLRASLKQTTGKDVSLDLRVDPSLLGGLVVRLGSRMVDTSLRTKLNNLRTAMKEVG